MKEDRREFIKKVVGGGLATAAFPHIIFGKESVRANRQATYPVQDAKSVRIALIGKGSQGSSDTRQALRSPGVKLVAVCDLYDARLAAAKKEWGDDVAVTREYKDILSRNDVDAVIIGTSDHWHQKISIEAMKAGKHVYCEKPVIHKIHEAKDLIKAQAETKQIFQGGSQGMASMGNRKAKQLVQSGAIGKVNFVEAAFTSGPRRPCNAPDGVSSADIWWERYVMNAKTPFAPERFFCWRHWKDYGTGLAGDLFVHVLSSLHYITGATGPEKVYTTGDVDGVGDTPYIMLGYFDYPDRNGIGAFKVALTANNADGVTKKWGSTDFTVVGNEGTLKVEWDKVTLKKNRKVSAADFGGLTAIGKEIDRPAQISDNELLFEEKGYNNCHFDHVSRFIEAIRNRSQVEADVHFAVQTAAPAILCFESYLSGKPVFWDADRLITKKSK